MKKIIIFSLLLPIFLVSGFLNDVTEAVNTAGYESYWRIQTRSTRTADDSDQTITESSKAITSAVKKTLPSVVTIIGREKLPQQEISAQEIIKDNPILSELGIDFSNIRFFTPSEVRQSSGSGFIISEDGYILTNSHVVDSSKARFKVIFHDGSEKYAEVVYRNQENDVAVIKVNGSYENVATLGDSSTLEIGQSIASIGNAFGMSQNSVSLGRILDFNKNIVALDGEETESLSGLIRSNARVVPGYSGGPVIDEDGNVIAMNVATGGRTSYLIPINTIKDLTERYI